MHSASFVDFLDAYGEACPPKLVYQEGEDFGQWQSRFRTQMESLLGPLPARVAPKAVILETAELETHTRHLLEIPVNDFVHLPAYLLVPRGASAENPRPGVLVSHGHHHHGIDSLCGLKPHDGDDSGTYNDALNAVESGYVVIAPAWWGWAGRDGHLGQTAGRDKCNVVQMAAGMYGLNVLALHIQDGQAALDVLAARPEVGADRIGCLGNSYGGRTTMWLTIFDERIKACIPAGCMNTFRERSLKLSSCAIQYLPGLLRYGDVPEVFSLIAPRPMQLHVGAQDGLITPADRDAMVQTVRRAYALLRAEENLDYAVHSGGHRIDWALAEAFLRKHLG